MRLLDCLLLEGSKQSSIGIVIAMHLLLDGWWKSLADEAAAQ
jgi:hypothetical protein